MVAMPIVSATAAAGIAIIVSVNGVPANDGAEAAVVLAVASTLDECGSVLDLRDGLGLSSVQALVSHNIIETTSGHWELYPGGRQRR